MLISLGRAARRMDTLGLPVAFGKQLPSKPEAIQQTPGESSRGGAAGRGSRGIVGGGKKSRGRGRGGGGNVPKHVSGSNAEAVGEAGSSKRSLDAMQNSNDPQAAAGSFNDAGFPGRPLPQDHRPFQNDSRGGRGGRGGHRGGGGGRGGGHQPPERGFYQPSFIEDPWKELMEARERRMQQEARG